MLWRSGPTHNLKDRNAKDLILYMLGLFGGWQKWTGNKQKIKNSAGEEKGMMDFFFF